MASNPCIGEERAKLVREATTLEALRDALNEWCPTDASPSEPCFCEHDVDTTNLPTYGGEEPEDTSYPIWSWDKDNYLTGACAGSAGFEITPRTEVDE